MGWVGCRDRQGQRGLYARGANQGFRSLDVHFHTFFSYNEATSGRQLLKQRGLGIGPGSQPLSRNWKNPSVISLRETQLVMGEGV